MRQCLLLGFVVFAFGLAARQLQGELSSFALAHLVVGAASLLAGALLAVRGLRRGDGSSAGRRSSSAWATTTAARTDVTDGSKRGTATTCTSTPAAIRRLRACCTR